MCPKVLNCKISSFRFVAHLRAFVTILMFLPGWSFRTLHYATILTISCLKPFWKCVATGSFLAWGEVGKENIPHLVVPITVEPTKPRVCHDERFLNCWIKDCPFSLDCIKDLLRYVGVGHYKTTFDGKSRYDHVFLHPSTYTFFGLEWEGRYFSILPCRLGGRQAPTSIIQ